LIFTDANTNGVFGIKSTDDVQTVVHGSEKIRYANFDVHPIQSNFILAIQEEQNGDTVKCSVVLINAENKTVEIIIQGANFYANPRFNCEGRKVCWMQWEHSDMPWLGSELYVADWTDGNLKNTRSVGGESGPQSVSRPQWHEDGSLFFASDRTGFAQLYRFDQKSAQAVPIVLEGFQDADIATKNAMRPHGL
jgi:Tol biopolymer transport system component